MFKENVAEKKLLIFQDFNDKIFSNFWLFFVIYKSQQGLDFQKVKTNTSQNLQTIKNMKQVLIIQFPNGIINFRSL